MTDNETCEHIEELGPVSSGESQECVDCVKIGSRWVHLRTCQECGDTRCCDSSPNRHASEHAAASMHPVIASAEPEERWVYCYPHELTAKY